MSWGVEQLGPGQKEEELVGAIRPLCLLAIGPKPEHWLGIVGHLPHHPLFYTTATSRRRKGSILVERFKINWVKNEDLAMWSCFKKQKQKTVSKDIFIPSKPNWEEKSPVPTTGRATSSSTLDPPRRLSSTSHPSCLPQFASKSPVPFKSGNNPVNYAFKPVDTMRCFIKMFSNPGDTVIDAFAGTHTTSIVDL